MSQKSNKFRIDGTTVQLSNVTYPGNGLPCNLWHDDHLVSVNKSQSIQQVHTGTISQILTLWRRHGQTVSQEIRNLKPVARPINTLKISINENQESMEIG